MFVSDIDLENFQIEDCLELDTSLDLTSYTNFEIQDHLDDYFRFFGSADMDIIYMYFISNKKQNELSNFFNKTQPAISYDVTRLKKQVEFVMYIVSVFDCVVDFLSRKDTGLSTYEIDLLTIFFFTTSFIKTSKVINSQQVTVRCQINRTIEKIKENGYPEIYKIFQKINCNLNKVKKNLEDDLQKNTGNNSIRKNKKKDIEEVINNLDTSV